MSNYSRTDVTIDMSTGEIIPAPSFEVTPTGLSVHGVPTFEQWKSFGLTLQDIRSSVQWAIGDWINYGQSRTDFGEKYDQALSETDFTYGYLRTMASVADRIPQNRRVDSLSWSHHQTVVSLPEPEQRKLLALAAPNPEEKRAAIPRDDLREMVKEIKRSGDNPNPLPPIKYLHNIDFEACEIYGNESQRKFVIQVNDVDAARRFAHFVKDHEPRLKLSVIQEQVRE